MATTVGMAQVSMTLFDQVWLNIDEALYVASAVS